MSGARRYDYRTLSGASFHVVLGGLILLICLVFPVGALVGEHWGMFAFFVPTCSILGYCAFYYLRRYFLTEVLLEGDILVERTGKRELRVDLASVVAYHEKGDGNWIEFRSGKKRVLTVDDSLSDFEGFVKELQSIESLKWR